MSDLMSKTDNGNTKIKVTSVDIDIVVHGTAKKPYYEIKYREVGKNDFYVGYSSYNLDFVFGWLKDCFEIIAESAKEPHEFKMRDATAEEQKYIQAKIDEIKEPQKCEWNRQGAEDFIITGCGHRPYKVIIDNCGFKIDFCPYCGRKIKEV